MNRKKLYKTSKKQIKILKERIKKLIDDKAPVEKILYANSVLLSAISKSAMYLAFMK